MMALSHRLPSDLAGSYDIGRSRPSLTFAPPRSEPVEPAPVRRLRAAERPLVLALVTALHVAGAVAFMRYHAPLPPAPPAPITVALIEPPVAIPAPPEPPPPPPEVRPAPPKPVAKPVVKPAPPKRKAAPPAPVPVTEAPTAVHSEPPPPSAPPPAAAPAEPAPPPPPAPAARVEAPAPRVAETVPARFDAAYLNNPAPAYPPLARRMREEGRVLLRVFVTADGAPGKIELSASSGSSRLDTAAENAVSKWRFVPAKQDGRSVDAWVVVPIVFKLEGS